MTLNGSAGAATAAGRNRPAGLAFWKKSMNDCTGESAPVSFDVQFASGPAAWRGGGWPPHRMPYSVQRNDASGPSDMSLGSNRRESAGAEQSSSLVIQMIARYASDRTKSGLFS